MPLRRKLTAACLWSLLSSLGSQNGSAEPRRGWDEGAPPHLLAVGRLLVPSSRIEDGRRRHHLEECSATLVALPGQTRSNTIVSAWHCIEDYADLSRPISFVLAPSGQERLRTTARRVSDGGHIDSDWAVLRLAKAVPVATASAIQVNWEVPNRERPVTMAGYSGDGLTGGSGQALSYHPDCDITGEAADMLATNCEAFKGASGGAVTQWNPASGVFELTGVISQGDSEGISLFVPTERFAGALRAAIR
ncbi:MAG: trypsin-like peptidase domain-containing protein [Pseudomonadota bacterium]